MFFILIFYSERVTATQDLQYFALTRFFLKLLSKITPN